MKNKYEINGEITTIFFNLRDGSSVRTLIDTNDLNFIIEQKMTLYVSRTRYVDRFYIKCAKRNRKGTALHRLLLSAPKGYLVDHINHDTLDNRKSNLRIATYSQNQQNKIGARKDSSSGIRNVMWSKREKRWIVSIRLDGKKKYFGQYTDLEEAIKASIAARAKHMPFSKEYGGGLNDLSTQAKRT